MPGLYVCQDISRLEQEQARTSGDYCALDFNSKLLKSSQESQGG